MTDRAKLFPPHPNGKTCTDCQFYLRWCKPVIGLDGTDTFCDYAPTRFAAYPERGTKPAYPEEWKQAQVKRWENQA